MQTQGSVVLLVITALMACLWWLLTGGALSSWLVGVPVVVLASWTLYRLRPDSADPFSVIGLIRFIPFFLLESLRGGIDVARRTLAPSLRIHPGFIIFPTRLERDAARVFFINCVSLLPGTLAADFNEDQLNIHLLDNGINPEDELRRLEDAVSRIYPQPNPHPN
ncbi:MAG: Na+/H+ antiporter subunit E [Gammaproteobacteria bacterium]|nr:Na+/H+ antiporter subunit E [Gammaproteobacteria bacterium]